MFWFILKPLARSTFSVGYNIWLKKNGDKASGNASFLVLWAFKTRMFYYFFYKIWTFRIIYKLSLCYKTAEKREELKLCLKIFLISPKRVLVTLMPQCLPPSGASTLSWAVHPTGGAPVQTHDRLSFYSNLSKCNTLYQYSGHSCNVFRGTFPLLRSVRNSPIVF